LRKIGIFGDSFGVGLQSGPNIGWSRLLENHYSITNHCECGIGEYKILCQIKNADLSRFDAIIVTHTSPTRVHTRFNPVHQNSTYHTNCDIIFSDIEHRKDAFSVMAHNYFKMVFDFDYYTDIHNLICKEIHQITQVLPTVHITHFDYNNLYTFDHKLINFYSHWHAHPGDVNHYSQFGNQHVYENLIYIIEQELDQQS